MQQVLARELASGRYGAVVLLTANEPMLADYRLVRISAPVHEQYYPVYLFLPK